MKYQDDMRDLLLNKGLLTSKPSDEIRVIALTETLSAMRQLDAKRNSFLIQFLYNAHLNGVNPITGAGYNIVNFFNADLSDIDFNTVDLSYANLHGVDLIGANLSGADLGYTSLVGAGLIDTDLHGAFLNDTDLSGANLFDADLRDANNLTQQQLDQVYTCRYANLPQGLTCNNNR